MHHPPELTIIGCGWLGRQYIAHAPPHYRLLATSHARDLPVPAHPYRWEHDPLPAPLRNSDAYLIALPPSAGGREHYCTHMQRLIAQLPPHAQIVMISSTAVYPDLPGHYDENTQPPANHPIVLAENAVRRHPRAIILRSGGQYGAGRLPLPKHHPLPDKRLNLVSGENLCRAITTLLQTPHAAGKIYNAVENDHPWRSEFAARIMANPPEFSPPENAQRLIDGSRITRETPFRYTKHNPLKT